MKCTTYIYNALVEKQKHMPPTSMLQSTLPLGTMKDNPIEINDETPEADFIEVGMDGIIGTALSM